MVSRIATATKTKALLIEYRLAPEHQFPAPLEDAIVAYGIKSKLLILIKRMASIKGGRIALD
jgi:acetyl esterase/lipase